jgi:glutathione synthase/RimK-type ligase-like ATP-grasp enzyme
MIITSTKELMARYNEVGQGDIFVGKLGAGELKSFLLVDLLERSVCCIPSPLSQIISGSKVIQALLLYKWMLPNTLVISRRKNLIDAISLYNRLGIESVITKEDRMHCGFGIRKWDSVETLYSFMSMSESSYPFILQPFMEKITDIRVVVAGDYIEAYTRHNPDNFRMNMAAGGSSSPFILDEEREKFCRAVMDRGRFPFAHIDVLVDSDGEYYLSEIALNGGIKGAAVGRDELERMKQEITDKLVSEYLSSE